MMEEVILCSRQEAVLAIAADIKGTCSFVIFSWVGLEGGVRRDC